jgi:hypothetical protein
MFLEVSTDVPLDVVNSSGSLKIILFTYFPLLSLLLFLWRHSSISGLGLLYTASPRLSIHCLSFQITYAQYLLGILLYCQSLSCFRFVHMSFATVVLYNIFLGVRSLSMCWIWPGHCSVFALTTTDEHGSSCTLYNSLYALFSSRHFLLLVLMFVSVFFFQMNRWPFQTFHWEFTFHFHNIM